ncbi:DUF4224 domain-containing protein [Jeongeupia naejangsanensis]|uniref:DUF4224 domain-containing protein n=1 Tax=Jeongeupia naejangsanensis TaxID=613195 RepID=A0ABS2BG37_9NEIS|nr:DUF4224 domain-containing protein [Jeongeupia naejangsanensis]MBM3114573.1 DUF4224 domain-containing protein [Jeongeupia naejangsanensis]
MDTQLADSQSMFLSQSEIRELTNCTQRRTQITALNTLGIEHRIRPDGSVLILRKHIERLLGGTIATERRGKVYEIDRSTM